MSPTLASPGSDLSNGTGTLNGDSRSFLVNEAGSPEYQRRAPGHNYGPIPNVFARETPEWMYEWARERQAQVLNTQRPLPTPPRLQEPQKAAPPVDRPEGVFQSAMRPVEAYGSAEYSASPARAFEDKPSRCAPFDNGPVQQSEPERINHKKELRNRQSEPRIAWEAILEREKKLEELVAHYQTEREQLARDRRHRGIWEITFELYV